MNDVYILIRRDKKDKFIEMLKKYNVGCKHSESPCVGIYTIKTNSFYFKIFEGDVIFHFKMDNLLYIKDYNPIGFRLFEFDRVEIDYVIRNERHDEILKIVYGEHEDDDDREYKNLQYLQYKMHEALTFTNAEYRLIKWLEEFELYDLKRELEKNSIEFSDVADYEEVSFEADPPEKEYMDRINALFAIIDNETESYAPFPEDESKKIIKLDLKEIKKTLKEFASDNGLSIKVNAKSLEIKIFHTYKIIKPLYMKELTEFYNFYYMDSEDFKIKIARELRMKEANVYY